MDIVKDHEELLKLDPGFEAFAPLAEELCSQGMWPEAVSVCRQGLSFHPEHFSGRVLLGWALMELGELDEAEKSLREAEGQVRRHARLFKMLARFAEQGGEVGRMTRLLSVYRNLGAMTSEQDFPSQPKAGSDQDIPSPSQTVAGSAGKPEAATQSPRIMGEPAVLLSSLIERFTAKPINMIDTHTLFTTEDRQALARILKSREL